jgi:hypothetical protein
MANSELYKHSIERCKVFAVNIPTLHLLEEVIIGRQAKKHRNEPERLLYSS